MVVVGHWRRKLGMAVVGHWRRKMGMVVVGHWRRKMGTEGLGVHARRAAAGQQGEGRATADDRPTKWVQDAGRGVRHFEDIVLEGS